MEDDSRETALMVMALSVILRAGEGVRMGRREVREWDPDGPGAYFLVEDVGESAESRSARKVYKGLRTGAYDGQVDVAEYDNREIGLLALALEGADRIAHP